MPNVPQVLTLIDHISSKLPNINLEGKISLSSEQLKLLNDFNVSSEELDQIEPQKLESIIAIVSAILNKYHLANKLIESGLDAYERGDILAQEQIYRDLCNEYLIWFQPECFNQHGVDFLKKMAATNVMTNKNTLCLQKIKDNHESIIKRDTPKDVVVIGAGPTGLMAAIKLYESGARVTLVEARKDGHLHTRKQAVVLDPSIMADLRHYLGDEYTDLFKKGYIHPDGRGHVVIKDLEKALFSRLTQLSAQSNDDLRVITGHAADKILPPDENHSKFRVSLSGTEETFNCDYVYTAEGGKNTFSDKSYLLGQAQKAEIETNTTPNTYITMLYDVSEHWDNHLFEPVQTEGMLKNIKQIRDKLKPTPEQKQAFSTWCEYFRNYPCFQLIAELNDDTIGKDLDQAFKQLSSLDLLPAEIDLRTFETKEQFYIATEVPPIFHHAMDLLNKISKRDDLSASIKQQAVSLQKSLQDEWSKLLYTSQFKFLNDRRVSLDYKSSQTFQVIPQGTSLAARILKKDDKQLMVVAGGDLYRSPHFYSGSGISSAHAGVNAFQRYFARDLSNPHEEQNHQRLFLADMQHIANFVDNKMGEYCKYTSPLHNPTKITIQEVSAEALEIDSLIKDIHAHHDYLKQGLSSFGFIRTLFQGLRQQKADVFENLLSRLNSCTTYSRLQSELADLSQADKNVLGRHRYSIWSSRSTTSSEFVSALQQRVDVAKNSEHIYTEIPDIKTLYQP